jgi:hypothetical protein
VILVSVPDARRPSKPQDRVRFPDGGPRFMMSSGCDGFAYDPAKVEDQVQFLARTLRYKTLEPDGQATGCKPVQVGSIPTGVSVKPAWACEQRPATSERARRAWLLPRRCGCA